MTLKISDWQVFCRKADLKLMGNSQENWSPVFAKLHAEDLQL